MKLNNYIFLAKNPAFLHQDFENWQIQFDESIDYEKEGYHFCLTKNFRAHQIVLYVVRYFYYEAGKIYVMEVSAMEEFKNIEDALARCNGIIEYYICGRRYSEELTM